MNQPSLKGSLERWTGFPKIQSAFGPVKMRRAEIEVSKQLGDVRPRKPPHYDLEDVYSRVVRSWSQDHSLDQIKLGDLRRLPWVLLFPEQKGRPRNVTFESWLGSKPDIVRQFGDWLSSSKRTGPILALLHEFLRVYPSALPTFDDIRQLLQTTIQSGSPPRSPSLRRWRERSRDFALLDDDRGLAFVRGVVSAAREPQALLHDAGLDAGLERCEFLKSGVGLYLREVKSLLDLNRLESERLGRLLALLESKNGLRFDDFEMREKIAEALLRPFASRTPEPKIKELLQPFFLSHYRDPRLPSGKHKWSGIQEECRRVVVRWLVERTLEQFFALVTDTAQDKHWRYREAFWRAFLKQDLIDDIWFVLGPRAKQRLRRIVDKDEGYAETTAVLQKAGADQSVLLLRIPGVTIAEWSHNGSCRCWLDGTYGAPELYQRSYSGPSLRLPADLSQQHHRSREGWWQDKIAKWLGMNTGIQIDRDAYFPMRLRKAGRTNAWRYRLR